MTQADLELVKVVKEKKTSLDVQLDADANKKANISLSWNNLTVDVLTNPESANDDNKQTKKGFCRNTKIQKRLLTNLNGSVFPGEMIAVMGTSGSGKTTLINALSGRLKGDITVSGNIFLNGRNREENTFYRLSAFVEQDDRLLPYMTVRETLYFAAEMRLPSTWSKEQKRQKAIQVGKQLGLSQCLDTFIGNDIVRGISGGERKRTAIAIEIIMDPRILFMDEPTSGLDAFTAMHVMGSVREIARGGRAIICAIHQPRNNIFNLFDKVLLLSQGKTVFYGTRENALNFFNDLNSPCPPLCNPADHYLDITTVDTRTDQSTLKTTKKVETFQLAYEQSNEDLLKEIDENNAQLLNEPIEANLQKAASWIVQFKALYVRSLFNIQRNKPALMIQFSQTFFFSLLIGAIFWQIPSRGETSIQNRNGALFFIILNGSFQSMFALLTLFHKEKSVFLRERASGTYSVSAYFLAKQIAELPFQMFFPFLYSSITYYMIGFRPEFYHFVVYTCVVLSCVFSAQSIGVFVGCVTPSIEIGNIIAPVLMVLFLLFGGLYVDINNIPVFLQWIKHVSFIQYGYDALLNNEYRDNEIFTDENLDYKKSFVPGLLSNGNGILVDVILLFIISFCFRLLGYWGLFHFSKPGNSLETISK